jgi:uncharacterized protein (TIGR03083 family)
MNMQPPKPVIVSDLFPLLLEELINLLDGLTTEEWDTPTICTPWSVKDICLHLLGVDIGNLSWKRDGFSVFREIESYEHLVQLINEQNARWVKSVQHISPKLLVDMLNFIGAQVTAYFQSLDPFELGVPVDWVSPDPAPIWLDLAREYTERWHHQQHIRDAVGKPGLKESRFLAPILDTFILALPRTFRTAVAEEGAALQINISGTENRDWILVFESGVWRLFEGIVENPLAGLSIPDDIAWRVFTKGISLEDARKQVRISGDRQLAGKILGTISIIA